MLLLRFCVRLLCDYALLFFKRAMALLRLLRQRRGQNLHDIRKLVDAYGAIVVLIKLGDCGLDVGLVACVPEAVHQCAQLLHVELPVAIHVDTREEIPSCGERGDNDIRLSLLGLRLVCRVLLCLHSRSFVLLGLCACCLLLRRQSSFLLLLLLSCCTCALLLLGSLLRCLLRSFGLLLGLLALAFFIRRQTSRLRFLSGDTGRLRLCQPRFLGLLGGDALCLFLLFAGGLGCCSDACLLSLLGGPSRSLLFLRPQPGLLLSRQPR